MTGEIQGQSESLTELIDNSLQIAAETKNSLT
jgi:hypothetical protein